MKSITIEAEVYLDEVMEKLKDEDLRAELSSRGIRDTARDSVIDAINQIRRGDYAEAITTLEREFMPKWQSTQHCERDLIRARAAT